MPLAPSNFTRDVPKDAQQIIVSALFAHNTLKTAASLARVPIRRLSQYMDWAKQTLEDPAYEPEDYTPPEHELLRFYEATIEASAQAEKRAVSTITEAASTDWKAASHLLKMRNPDEWAEKRAAPASSPPVGQTGAGDPLMGIGAGSLDLRRLTTDELETLQFLMRKAAGLDDNVIDAAPERRMLE